MNGTTTTTTLLHRLHAAIKNGDVTRVLECTSSGHDSDVTINVMHNGHTAMTYALDVSADDVIPKALLALPAFDPHVGNRHQRSPLFEAARHGRDEVVMSLLRLGARVDAPDQRGVTPLAICAVYNRYTTARILLSNGADVMARDSHGDTPLHCACSNGSAEVVAVLLDYPGCDVRSVNRRNQTALMLCLPSAYEIQVKGQPLSRALSLCRRLLQTGSDVLTTVAQRTALHDRVSQNDLAGASLLLHHCSELVNCTDKKGLTALEMNLSSEGPGHHEMALCLLHYGASPSRLLPASEPRHSNENTPTDIFHCFKQSVTPNSSSDPASEFHRLRFLEALLASSFVTLASLWRLVHLDLLTPDSLEDVRHTVMLDHSKDESVSEMSSWKKKLASRSSMLNGVADLVVAEGRSSVNSQFTMVAGSRSCGGQYDAASVECVSVAVRHCLTLQHQCRLVIRQKLGASLRVALPHLGLPRRVQDYVSLGVDMHCSSPLHVAELHVAITEHDVGKARQLLQDGVEVNSPFMEHTPLTRALELEPSHHDVNLDDVSPTDADVCGMCGSKVGTLEDEQDARLVDEYIMVEKENRKNTAVSRVPAELEIDGPCTSDVNDDSEEHDVMTLLLCHGASLSMTDPLGDTPLHVAVRRGSCVVRRLLATLVSSSASSAHPLPLHSVCSLQPSAAQASTVGPCGDEASSPGEECSVQDSTADLPSRSAPLCQGSRMSGNSGEASSEGSPASEGCSVDNQDSVSVANLPSRNAPLGQGSQTSGSRTAVCSGEATSEVSRAYTDCSEATSEGSPATEGYSEATTAGSPASEGYSEATSECSPATEGYSEAIFEGSPASEGYSEATSEGSPATEDCCFEATSVAVKDSTVYRLPKYSVLPIEVRDRSGLTPLETALLKGDMDTVRVLLLWAVGPPVLATADTQDRGRQGSDNNGWRSRTNGQDGEAQNQRKTTLEEIVTDTGNLGLRETDVRTAAAFATSSSSSSASSSTFPVVPANIKSTETNHQLAENHEDFEATDMDRYIKEPARLTKNTNAEDSVTCGESPSHKDAHCSLQDAHCSLQDAHCSLQDAHCSLQDARCSLQDAHCSLQDARLSRVAAWVGMTGVTALHCAAAAGLPAVTEALITHGSPVNTEDTLGNTPLHAATSKGTTYASTHPHHTQSQNDFWRNRLRVWPKCHPRPFPSHSLYRRADQSRGSLEDVKDSNAILSGSAEPPQQILSEGDTDFTKQCGEGLRTGVSDMDKEHTARKLNTYRNFSRVSYQFTVGALLRHGAQ